MGGGVGGCADVVMGAVVGAAGGRVAGGVRDSGVGGSVAGDGAEGEDEHGSTLGGGVLLVTMGAGSVTGVGPAVLAALQARGLVVQK